MQKVWGGNSLVEKTPERLLPELHPNFLGKFQGCHDCPPWKACLSRGVISLISIVFSEFCTSQGIFKISNKLREKNTLLILWVFAWFKKKTELINKHVSLYALVFFCNSCFPPCTAWCNFWSALPGVKDMGSNGSSRKLGVLGCENFTKFRVSQDHQVRWGINVPKSFSSCCVCVLCM